MSIFKAGTSPTTIYAWAGGQRVISRVYVWVGGAQHTVWDQSLDASVGPPKSAATALALPPGVTSSPPVIAVPGPAVTSSALARPPVVTATSSVHVLAPAAGAGTVSMAPAVEADAVLGVEVATAGADAIPTVNDVLLLPPAAASTAMARVPGVDFGGNAFVSAPVALATAAGVVPAVSANKTVTAPVVTATAAGTVPSPDNATPTPAAVSTGSAAVPGISKGVPAVAATAAGSGIVPVLAAGSLILPPAAAATATGIVPQVISAINASVTVPGPSTTSSALARPSFVIVDYTDDFNRANTSTLGANYDQGGTGSGIGITSNQAAFNSTTDGRNWALHKGSLFTDAHYTHCTAKASASGHDSSLFIGCNSTMTVGAYLNWFNNTLYFGRFNGTFPTLVDIVTGVSATISSGTLIEFYRKLVSGHYTYFVDIAGVNKITSADTTDAIAISSSNRRVGVGMSRASFANSNAFDDWEGKDYIL